MDLVIEAFASTPRFEADACALPDAVFDRLEGVLDQLKLNPRSNALRLHALKGYSKPTIYVVDVTPRSNRAPLTRDDPSQDRSFPEVTRR